VNDVLLSAPSIIIGLFVYEVLVVAWDISQPLQARWRSRSSPYRFTVRTTEDIAAPCAAGNEGCLHGPRRISVADYHKRRISGTARTASSPGLLLAIAAA